MMANFWAHIADLYGDAWAREYGAVPKPDNGAAQKWRYCLAQLSASQIKRGQRECLMSPDRFPPRPGQFLEMAGFTPESKLPAHQPFVPRDRLLMDEKARANARRNLKSMMDSL